LATTGISALVKFCNADTGLKHLSSQSLRWSSPHLFNDPFEASHLFSANITPETLLKGLTKEALTMLFGPNEPTGKDNRLIAAIARWRDEERFASEVEAEQVLKQLLSQVANRQQQNIDSFMADWRKFASNLRVCCFADKADNMTCWQRYANNHSGIALRLAAGEGNSLKDPRRLSYQGQPLQITSLKQQVDIAYGKQQATNSDEFINSLLVKNKENSTEREWRCFGREVSPLKPDDKQWYTDKPFATHELKAVYLGVAAEQSLKDTVTALVKKQYPKSKIYQAQVVTGEYALEFTALN
jgi:hypothetical protein